MVIKTGFIVHFLCTDIFIILQCHTCRQHIGGQVVNRQLIFQRVLVVYTLYAPYSNIRTRNTLYIGYSCFCSSFLNIDNIIFRLFCFGPLVYCSQTLLKIWFFNISILSVPDEKLIPETSCALNLISTFLFLRMVLRNQKG